MASHAATLKKKAAEFEQKKQFDKALALYRQVLDDDDGDEDVSLFNRVGDMYLRSGQVGDAMEMFERAVDRYDDQGLYNNAIALCNKILRQSPGRISVYYKLGKVAAKKGFKNDAKANFLEYATRKQKEGNLNEAFRALKEFADLCPDQDDIRLMLADQLTKEGRQDEALEQLQMLYERYVGEGNTAAAQATVARMKAIDPEVEPSASSGPVKHRKSSDLVFLDLDDLATGPRKATPFGSPTVPPAPVAPPVAPPALELADPIAMASDPAFDLKVERRPTGDLPLLSLTPPPPRVVPPPAAPAAAAPPVAEPPVVDIDEVAASEVGPVLAEYGESMGVPVDKLTGEQAVIDAGAGDDEFGFLDFEDATAPAAAEAESADLDIVAPADRAADGPAPVEVDMVVPDIAPVEADRPVAEPVEAESFDILSPEPLAPPADDLLPADLEPIEPLTLDATSAEASSNPFDLPFITDEGGVTESAADSASSRPTTAQPLFTDPTPAETSALLDAAFPLDGMLQPELPSAELLGASTGLSSPPAAESLAEPEPAPAQEPEPSLAAASTDAPVDAPVGDLPTDEIAAFMADEPPRRRTSVSLARNVVSLRARLDREPENWDLMRTYGEALLDDGEREAGLAALEAAMAGYEKGDDLISARSVADEIVRLVPTSIKHQQKRVEYCFRGGDRAGLVDAYVDLADALLRDGQTDKARSVYGRVLELAPGEVRAETALQSFVQPEPAAPVDKPREKAKEAGRYAGTLETPLSTPAAPPPPPAAEADDFIDLGDLLRDELPEKNTRMVVAEHEPTGDEDADFQDMLRKFKQGVAENVEEEDYDSHYDLGVAFKEMGLLDEAIGEFQKALRGTQHRIRTHEALGQCFIEKQMWPVAATILQKATLEPTMDDAQLIGVLYLLGQAYEELARPADALTAYQRVYGVDIGFRDVAQRVSALSAARR